MKEEVKQGDTKPKYDPKELLAIFDTILFEGKYSEEVSIRGKLKVQFKSRSVGEVSEISGQLDTKSYNLISTLQEQRAILNLAYSLEAYNNKPLSALSKEEKVKFINSLPASVVATLSEKLLDFDQKVDAACKEGEGNF